MIVRTSALVAVLVSLVSIDPQWLTPQWGDFPTWLTGSPPEEVTAALLRLVAIALVSSQLVGLGLAGVGNAVGNGLLARIGRRLVLPVLRSVIPLAVAAGPAVPALASVDPGMVPAPVAGSFETPPPPQSVIVEPGDSMWTIADRHAPNRVDSYWIRVVELNRDRFDDVDLIHPGDVVLLPISDEDADPHPSHPVVDVGVDEDDRLPGPEGEGSADDGNHDRRSDPGGENVVPPMPRRTVPMLPPIIGG